ncbi:YadA-like family protein [Histophilus somni]|uniref:YadA-like family protein n=1 Tax=Histophilus somni TaxID=731 RepID=UPI00201E8CA6|nr:YadA-like family protein [Histophilus somni]
MNKIFKTKYDAKTGQYKAVSELAKNCQSSSSSDKKPKCGGVLGNFLGMFKIAPLALVVSGLLSGVAYAADVWMHSQQIDSETDKPGNGSKINTLHKATQFVYQKNEDQNGNSSNLKDVAKEFKNDANLKEIVLFSHQDNKTGAKAKYKNIDFDKTVIIGSRSVVGGHGGTAVGFGAIVGENTDTPDTSNAKISVSKKEAFQLMMTDDSYRDQHKQYFDLETNLKWKLTKRQKQNAILDDIARKEEAKLQAQKKDPKDTLNQEGTAVGYKSFARGQEATAIGNDVVAWGDSSIAMGSDNAAMDGESKALSEDMFALYYNARADFNDTKSYAAVKFEKPGNMDNGNKVEQFYNEEGVFLADDGATISGKDGRLYIRKKMEDGKLSSEDFYVFANGIFYKLNGQYLKEVDTEEEKVTIKTLPDWQRYEKYKQEIKSKYEQYLKDPERFKSHTWARGNNAIAIGARSVAYGKNSTALGTFAFAGRDYSTALGSNTLAFGERALAVGNEAYVYSNESVGVGNKVQALNDGSMVYGANSYAGGRGSLAIGDHTFANVTMIDDFNKNEIEKNTFGLTDDETSYRSEKIDIEDLYEKGNTKDIQDKGKIYFAAKTTKQNGTDEYKAEQSQDKDGKPNQGAIALGSYAVALGDNTLALGRFAYARDDAAMAIGRFAFARDENSFAVGSFSRAMGKNAVAMGIRSMVDKDNSMAIGNYSEADFENSIALGYRAKTDYTAEELAKAAWAPKNALAIPSSEKIGYLSVGGKNQERRIVNVAPGALDTDAVNVSQLKALEETILYGNIDNSTVNIQSGHYVSIKGSSDFDNLVTKEQDYQRYVKLKADYLKLLARKDINGETFKQEALDKMKERLDKVEAKYTDFKTHAGELTKISPDTFQGKFNEQDSQYQSMSEEDKKKAKWNLTQEEIKKIDTALKADERQSVITEDEKQKIASSNFNNDGAKGQGSIAIGVGSKAETGATNAVVVGNNSKVSSPYGVAIGNKAEIGTGADESIVIASVNKDSSKGSLQNAKWAVAIGNKNNVTGGNDIVAIGSNINVTKPSTKGNDSLVIIGNGATASGAENSVVIGRKTKVQSENALALGQGSKILTGAKGSIAIGVIGDDNNGTTVENAEWSLAVGNKTNVKGGNDIVALGNNIEVTTNHATNGQLNNSLIVIGNKASANDATNSVVIGQGAESKAESAVVIGDSASVAKDAGDSIALGKGSKVTEKKNAPSSFSTSENNGIKFTWTGAGVSTGEAKDKAVVSVGDTDKERVITHVAAGTVKSGSTDAVNAGQLYSVIDVFAKLGTDVLGAEAETGSDKTGFKKTVFTKLNDATATSSQGTATQPQPQSNSQSQPGNSSTKSETDEMTFKDAIEKNIAQLNKGFIFSGNLGTTQTLYLGSTLNIKAGDITETIKTTRNSRGADANNIGGADSSTSVSYKGDNLKTEIKAGNNGTAELLIGLTETPTFKKVTVTEEPTGEKDLVTKAYVDSKITSGSGTGNALTQFTVKDGSNGTYTVNSTNNTLTIKGKEIDVKYSLDEAKNQSQKATKHQNITATAQPNAKTLELSLNEHLKGMKSIVGREIGAGKGKKIASSIEFNAKGVNGTKANTNVVISSNGGKFVFDRNGLTLNEKNIKGVKSGLGLTEQNAGDGAASEEAKKKVNEVLDKVLTGTPDEAMATNAVNVKDLSKVANAVVDKGLVFKVGEDANGRMSRKLGEAVTFKGDSYITPSIDSADDGTITFKLSEKAIAKTITDDVNSGGKPGGENNGITPNDKTVDKLVTESAVKKFVNQKIQNITDTANETAVKYDSKEQQSITLGGVNTNKSPVAIHNLQSGLYKLNGVGDKAESFDALLMTLDGKKDKAKAKADAVKKVTEVVEKLVKNVNKDSLHNAANVGDLKALAVAGLNFAGNDGKDIHKNLGEKLEIVGKGLNKAKSFKGTNGNIAVKADSAKSKLEISLNEELKGMKSISGREIGNGKGGKLSSTIEFNKQGESSKTNVAILSNGGKFVFDRTGLTLNEKNIKGVKSGLGLAEQNAGGSATSTNTEIINKVLDGTYDKDVAKNAVNVQDLSAVAKAIADKVQTGVAQASTVVFTDGEGNKLTKVNDKYYKSGDIGTDGQPKGDATEVTTPQLSLVDHKGETKNPVALGNVASGLGIDDIQSGGVASIKQGKQGELVKQLVAGELDTTKDASGKAKDNLHKVVNLADLKAVAQAGLNFAGNDGRDIHKNLSETLAIVGQGLTKDTVANFKGTDGNIAVKADNGKLSISLNEALTGLKSAEFTSEETNSDGTKQPKTKTTINGKGTTIVELDKDGKKANYGLDGASIVNGNKSTLISADGTAVTHKDGSGIKTTITDKDGIKVIHLDGNNHKAAIYGADGISFGKDGKITGLADPTESTDAANKGYVDEKVTDLDSNRPFDFYIKDGDKEIKVVKGRDGKFYKPEDLNGAKYDESGKKYIKNIENNQSEEVKSSIEDRQNEVVIKAEPTNKAIVVTNIADGKLAADSKDAINGGQLVKATGAKLIDVPSSTSDSPKPKITVFADGKDGKSGREIDKDPMANKGLTAKDGLNGKNANDKANALRDGEAGTVVFTDKDGNRLVKADNGKYYKADDVNADGSVKKTDGQDAPKPVDTPQLSLVNPKDKDKITTPVVLGNVASGLGVEPYSKEAEKEISKLVDDVKSKANDVNTKAEQVSTKLDAVSTLADVIAAKQEAINAEKSTIATLSEGEEKTKLQEALKVKEEALKKEEEKLTAAKNELKEAKEGLSKAKEDLKTANTAYSKKLESANVKVADLVKADSEAKLTNVATVGDLQAVARAGINFEGNDGVPVHKNLGEKLTIKGEGEFNSATTAAGNIKVTASDSGMEMKLSDTLKNMTSFETKETAEGNKSRLDGNGLTVTGKNNQSAHYGSGGITLKEGNNKATLTSSALTFTNGQGQKVEIDGEKGEIRVPDLTSNSSPNAVANKQYVDALQTHTDQKFNHLDNKIEIFNKDLRAGVAGAHAAAALPTVTMPGKSSLALSAGTYKGNNAVALGYSRLSDNGKIMLKLHGSRNSAGDFGGGVGVGWTW